MAAPTLVVESLVQLGTCASFLYVGQTLRHRGSAEAAGDGASRAARAFIVWWWSLGAYLGLVGLSGLAAVAGVRALPVFLAVRIVSFPLLAASAWGICTYVLYLFTGRRVVFTITTIYAVLAGFAFALQTWIDAPSSVVVGDWSAGLAPPADRTLLNAVYAFFAIPLIASTLAYASLFARVRDPMQRYRIALVSGSILAWVVGGFAGASSGNALAQFVTVTLLGLVAALAVLLAYKPPAFVVARLGRDANA